MATEANVLMYAGNPELSNLKRFSLLQSIPPSAYLTGRVACISCQSHLCTGLANHNHTLISPVCRMLALLASAK
jgi:hypothetical protein